MPFIQQIFISLYQNAGKSWSNMSVLALFLLTATVCVKELHGLKKCENINLKIGLSCCRVWKKSMIIISCLSLLTGTGFMVWMPHWPKLHDLVRWCRDGFLVSLVLQVSAKEDLRDFTLLLSLVLSVTSQICTFKLLFTGCFHFWII